MDLAAAIETRASAVRLGEPGPTAEQLGKILNAAARAPDHGRLAPWRFVVIEGTARERFGAAMAEGLRLKSPEVEEEVLTREAAKAMRAPVIVAVAARIAKGKIPEIEQMLAVGAAIENMVLMAHSLGLGSMWKTGAAAYDRVVKKALGLQEDDQIAGFVYLGSQDQAPPPRPVQLEGIVSRL